MQDQPPPDPALILLQDHGGTVVRVRALDAESGRFRFDLLPHDESSSFGAVLTLDSSGRWCSQKSWGTSNDSVSANGDEDLARKLMSRIPRQESSVVFLIPALHKAASEARRITAVERFRQAVRKALGDAPVDDLRTVLDSEVCSEVHSS